MYLLKIVPEDTKLQFIRWRNLTFVLSAVLMVASVFLFMTRGLNYGIDFRGGTLIEIRVKQGPADLADLRAKLGTLGLGDVQIQ